MDRRNLLLLSGSALIAQAVLPKVVMAADMATEKSGQPYPEPNTGFLKKAEKYKPSLLEETQTPIGLVETSPDPSLPLGWRVYSVGNNDDLEKKVLKKGDSIIVDFGGHRTGYFSFDLVAVGRSADAPARLKLIFGEVVTDVSEPFHPYKGTLSEAWLPEEIITVDDLPQSVRMPRRYAFRFVKIEVIATSISFSISFRNVRAHAVTSARSALRPLPANIPQDLRKIDLIAAATLRDCMQTTFEDGPRRDRRLWTGDLRLQALTSYIAMPNVDLVRRCLFLLAAYPRADGMLAGCVFERPVPARGEDLPYDYAVLYTIAVADFVDATKDKATGNELWPTALKQIEVLRKYVGDDGVFALKPGLWIFVDWQPTLDRQASMHAIYLYGVKRLLELAAHLNRTDEVREYAALVPLLERAALGSFFDASQDVFVSGRKKQISLASQAWMTIAGVGSRELQAKALRTALNNDKTVRPLTPYLNHYVCEALFLSGCRDEALQMIRAYWGGMVEAGADTFWEAYAPEKPRAQPYGDFHINSFCHAWSCTPSYLLRRYANQI